MKNHLIVYYTKAIAQAVWHEADAGQNEGGERGSGATSLRQQSILSNVKTLRCRKRFYFAVIFFASM